MSKKKKYLFNLIVGLILIVCCVYSAYVTHDDFTLFVRIIMLILLTVYTVNNILTYIKLKE
jgi:hypothetical protein